MSFTETLQGSHGQAAGRLHESGAVCTSRCWNSSGREPPTVCSRSPAASCTISVAEILIGKLLSNNLINLGLYDEARDALAAVGKSLSDIEEVEPEPSLGNGGLGRLAACFLDSLATLNLPGDGVGLRYHFGLFHPSFEDGVQNEKPDPWLTAHSWAEKTDITYPVELAGKEYTARLYKLAVTGYEGRTNTLNLFDLDTID